MNEQSEATDPIELATSIIHIWALTLQLPMRRLVGKNMLGKGAAYGFGLRSSTVGCSQRSRSGGGVSCCLSRWCATA